MDNLEMRVKNLEDDMREVKMTCKDISDRLIRMEEKLKGNKEKMNDLDANTKALLEMSSSVKLLTNKVEDMMKKLTNQEDTLDEQDRRLNTLERAPGKFAIKGWMFVASTVGAALIGAVITLLSKGGI